MIKTFSKKKEMENNLKRGIEELKEGIVNLNGEIGNLDEKMTHIT